MIPEKIPTRKAVITEILAPKIAREKTSRPRSSVPNRYWELGAWNRAMAFISKGFLGAKTDAEIATMTKNNMSRDPIRVFLLFRKRLMNRLWDDATAFLSTETVASFVTDAGVKNRVK